MSQKNTITQEQLKSVLEYNPETGVFTYKFRKECTGRASTFNTRYAGKDCCAIDDDKYIVITIRKKQYRAHRLAWIYVNGNNPINDIDHINGIRDDNRICNLREATRSQNMQNLKKAHKDTESGLLGAYRDKGKIAKQFYSEITTNGNKKFIGYFYTAQEAHEAHIKEKRELHEFNTL